MNQEKIIVIDFGGQYNQLVARRVRECHVYCEIYSYRTPIEQIKAMNPKGIILTGGPNSVYEEGAATCSKELFEMGVPVLGLCYGAQLMAYTLGGSVTAGNSEYGKVTASIDGTVVAGTGAVYEPEEDISDGADTGDTDAAASIDTAAADKEARDTPAGETHTALWVALAAVVIACAVLLIVKRKGATK